MKNQKPSWVSVREPREVNRKVPFIQKTVSAMVTEGAFSLSDGGDTLPNI